MGLVRVAGEMGAEMENLKPMRFLVDTGSFYTLVSPAQARDLGIEANTNVPVIMADGRTVSIRLGIAIIKVMERHAGVPVAIMECPEPLLGVTALEGMGLKVNPVNQTLEYDSPLAAPPMFLLEQEHLSA
jgi:clan AA aspartic protease